ncbi:hypothetical protein [Sphingomonas faeni]
MTGRRAVALHAADLADPTDPADPTDGVSNRMAGDYSAICTNPG